MACQDCSPNSKKAISDCTDCGVRKHTVVDTYAEVQEFRNMYVTVRDENAVYHVDEIGNPVAVSRSFIFKTDYTPSEGEYKQNIVFDLVNDAFYVYDPAGQYKTGVLS